MIDFTKAPPILQLYLEADNSPEEKNECKTGEEIVSIVGEAALNEQRAERSESQKRTIETENQRKKKKVKFSNKISTNTGSQREIDIPSSLSSQESANLTQDDDSIKIAISRRNTTEKKYLRLLLNKHYVNTKKIVYGKELRSFLEEEQEFLEKVLRNETDKKNQETILKIVCFAVKKRNRWAQYYYGLCHLRGLAGMEQSDQEALTYFDLSAKQNCLAAIDLRAEILKKQKYEEL